MRLQQEQHVPGRRAVRLGAFRGGREMQLGKDDFVETCTMAVCFFLLCVLVVLLRCYLTPSVAVPFGSLHGIL